MILGFHCHGLGSIPGWGTEMLQVMLVQPKKKKNCNRVDLRCIASCKADKLEPLRANLLEGKQNNSRFLLHLGPLIWSYVRLKAGLAFIATSALTFIH